MMGLLSRLFSRGVRKMKAKEVLVRAFQEVLPNLDAERIELVKPIRTLIADDSDHHRIRRGWMRYDELYRTRVASRTIFLGLGEPEGSYPAAPYHSDVLLAVYDEDPETLDVVREDITRKGYFFRLSFLIATNSGFEIPFPSAISMWWTWDKIRWNRLAALFYPPEGKDPAQLYVGSKTLSQQIGLNPDIDPAAVRYVREALLARITGRPQFDA